MSALDCSLDARSDRLRLLIKCVEAEFEALTAQQRMGYAVFAMQRDLDEARAATNAAFFAFREST